MEQSDSAALCGIDGKDEDYIRVGQLNRLASEIKFYHYRPVKQKLERVELLLEAQNKIMSEHIVQDQLFHAKLAGARWALYATLGALAALLGFIYKVLEALHILIG